MALERRDYLSFSSLELFNKCQTWYKHKYIQGTESIETVQEPLIKGSLMHVLLEFRLTDVRIEDAINLAMPAWVEKTCGLKIASSESDMQSAKGIYLPVLINYAWEVSSVLLRCAANYREKDVIRNKDGSVPKDPVNFPPLQVKKALDELQLNEDRYMIDLVATQLNPDFKLLSLANIAAHAVMLARNFKKPKNVTTVSVEEGFGSDSDGNEISPRVYTEGYWWKGAIDWVVNLPEGLVPDVEGEPLGIFDHKSGSKPFDKVAVRQHPQLNLYAWIYYEVHGRMPDVIGISQPSSGRLIYEPVDIDNVMAVKDWVKNQAKALNAAIETDSFAQHHPNEYNTPCLTRDFKTGMIKHTCPYLVHCWPGYAQDLNHHEGLALD